MKVFINGAEESQPYAGKTVGDVLEEVIQSKVFGGTFICGLRLDSKDVDIDSREVRQVQVGTVNSLEIEVASLSGLISKNISNAEDYLQRFIPGIEKAADLFRSGNEQEASKFFINIIDGIEWFSRVVDTVLKVMGENSDSICFNRKSVVERKEQLLNLTSQMVTANKTRDWVLLADLLEYETLPYYKEWQSILPDLKQAGLEKIN